MKLNQTYVSTPKINELIIGVEANKKALSLLNVPVEQIKNLRRRSFLSSAVYSARIENNSLTPESFSTTSKSFEHLEIQNLLDTLNWIYTQDQVLPINLHLIRSLHKRSMHNLHAEAGHFRTEQSAIFNMAGIAIYLTPPVSEIIPLLTTWLTNLNNPKLPIAVQIAVSHFQFEKIHPFLDGNGRVGRLLTTVLLKNYGLDLHGIVNFEKYLENYRDDYYAFLAEEKRDITHFVEYFLTAIYAMQESALTQLTSPQTPHVDLTPRHQEIVATIADHPYCTFDFLHRRFFAIPKPTLHYDLQQLQKKGVIKKNGAARSAAYLIVS